MLDGIPDDEYAGQGSIWTAFDLRKSCVRQIEKGKALYRNLVEPCSTPLAIQDMASIYSVSCLRFLRMSVWILRRYEVQGFWQYFLWMVSTDPIVVWDEYANPLSAWLFEVAHYVGGSRWSQSLVGLNHRIFFCGTQKRLPPFAVLKLICSISIVLSLSTMVRPVHWPNPYQGPARPVSNEAFIGVWGKNHFNIAHMDLHSTCLVVDGPAATSAPAAELWVRHIRWSLPRTDEVWQHVPQWLGQWLDGGLVCGQQYAAVLGP